MATDLDERFRGWQHEDMMGQEDSEDPVLPHMLDHGSVSFGKYDFESLSWERRSAFTYDRRMEELEKLKAPGLVSKKKAFFEEYYKRLRAMKSLQVSDEAGSSLDCGLDDNPATIGVSCEDKSLNHTESPAKDAMMPESSSIEGIETESRGHLRNLSNLDEAQNIMSSSEEKEEEIITNGYSVELLQDWHTDGELNSCIAKVHSVDECIISAEERTVNPSSSEIMDSASLIDQTRNAEIRKECIDSNQPGAASHEESVLRKDPSCAIKRKNKFSSNSLHSSQSVRPSTASGKNKNDALLLKKEPRNRFPTDKKPGKVLSERQSEKSKIDGNKVSKVGGGGSHSSKRLQNSRLLPSSLKTSLSNTATANGAKSTVLEKKMTISRPRQGHRGEVFQAMSQTKDGIHPERSTAKPLQKNQKKPVNLTTTSPGPKFQPRKISVEGQRNRRESKPWR
ncbi:uncharacterized protein LOC144705483 [Wolffia australiana]